MAILEQIVQFSTILSGDSSLQRFGDKHDATDLTVTGQVFDSGNIPLADNFTAITLWQANQGGMASFNYLLFHSTVPCWLEIANTTPNPDERALIFVPANGVAVIPSPNMGGYASNTTRLDGADLVLATDYNAISEIRVQSDNADLAGDGLVRLMLVL